MNKHYIQSIPTISGHLWSFRLVSYLLIMICLNFDAINMSNML